jgi:pyrimidine-nucleoside phosphorylase
LPDSFAEPTVCATIHPPDTLEDEMHIPELIARKRDGEALSDEELEFLVQGYTDDEIPDYQMSAFLMAVFFQSMTHDELSTWTRSMLHSGEVLDLSDIQGVKVDKHSTGGVGDKVSLILAPLAVAAGLKVPMISGRGLGHTGGTLDKLESIPGFDVNQPVERFRQLVDELGCGLIGQTGEIAPADKQLYALRDVTATVECIPLIASSIMSKKLAEGIDGLVLDVKVGSGAFMKEVDQARELAETMIGIGDAMDTPVRALVTDMDQPLGLAVGNALEVQESIETLRGEGPRDLTDITVALVTEMLDLAGMSSNRSDTKQMLVELLQDGSALDVFRDIIEEQDGDPSVCDDPSALPTAEHVETFEATRAGKIHSLDAQEVGLAALELGAGRRTKEDDIDPAVGLVFRKKRGADVDAGEPILHIHYNDESDLESCRERLERAIHIEDGAVEEPPLIIDRLG